MPSIRHRINAAGDAMWQVRYRHHGKQTSNTFATEKAARQFLRLIDDIGTQRALEILAVRENAGITTGTPTLREFGHQAIDARPGIATATRKRYHRQLDAAFPSLAPLPVDAITRAEVIAWLDSVSVDWSGKTLANYRGLLTSIFNDAIRAGLITANPTAGIRLPGSTQGEMTFLTPDEFAHIHAHAPAFGKDLLTVLVGTGLRIGEATALQVRDFDPGAGTLTVTRAWKSGGVLGPPKTRKSRRTIHVPDHVANALTRGARGRATDDWLYVTPPGYPRAPAGLPWSSSKFYRRIWTPALALAGADHDDCAHSQLLKTPRVHDLRHTCASWMLGGGVPIAAVSRHLGHESITTTVDRYGHLDPTIARQAADAAGAALAAALG